jgi:hypothetical protein
MLKDQTASTKKIPKFGQMLGVEVGTKEQLYLYAAVWHLGDSEVDLFGTFKTLSALTGSGVFVFVDFTDRTN